MWVLSVGYIIKFRVQASIIVSKDQLVLTSIVRLLIKSFTEVAYLVIVRVVHESNHKFSFGGRFQ